MIVSFERRFIFVAIPKTATHAFRTALRPRMGSRDWEQCVLFDKKFFPVEPLARIGHGHISALEVQPFLLPAFWDTALRFCTVRNPFDRFVSCCHFANRGNRRMVADPLGTMKQAIRDCQHLSHILFRPQSAFITGQDGASALVNFVCKFETLQHDFNQVCQRLGLPPSPLEVVNSSDSPDYRGCYDRELKDLVREAYREDFDRFDYALDPESELATCR
jgi:hypothetical protein